MGRHYARKYDRQVRRANRHAFRAGKGGWGHSYRGQQHQLYKAAKHDAKAQYAANMYAAKTGGLGLYGRQLRSANHYARKYDRQVRRPTDTRFGPARADGDTATAASSTSCPRRPSTMLRRSTPLTCTLPRLAASVCMAVSSAAPTTTLESMTARCAAPTDTRFGPVRADGDTATAASSTSCTRRPSTMLRRSTQLTCTLPKPVSSD